MTAAAGRLADAGIESPRVDAELLLAHVLGVTRARLLTLDDVGDEAAGRFEALLGQRADRVPLQHLTGRAPFRYLELAVGPGVFVPRPETELLVGWALEQLSPVAEPVVVDLGSGSGAIALSIAAEHPGARVTAVERDPGAIEWTRHNARARAAAGDTPVEVVAGYMTDPALLHEHGEPAGVGVGDRVEGEQAGARHREHVGEQQFGVHARGLDAHLGEEPRGIADQRAGVQEPAASSSAVCALLSASMTGSRSPSRTWSRLCAL